MSYVLCLMSNSDNSKVASKLCILNAATRLFAKLGLDKCSTREIAKQSDSNISLISYYFGGKEGLYKEVMHQHALEIREKVQEVFNSYEKIEITVDSFKEEMSVIIQLLIEFRLKNPEMAQIFAREKLAGLPYSREIHQEVFYPLVLKFFDLLKQAQKKGFVKKEINPAVFFITLSEGIWGFYEMSDCKTSISNECQDIILDPKLFKEQIMNIYLTGVFV